MLEFDLSRTLRPLLAAPRPLARRLQIGLLCLLASCASGGAAATSDKSCQRPIAPEVPNAATASQVEMVSARVRITMYLEAANAFLACLDEAEKNVSETAREVKLKRITRKREEIQAEMTTVTERFNQEVGRYRETDADSSPAEPGAEGGAASDPAPADAGTSSAADPQSKSK